MSNGRWREFMMDTVQVVVEEEGARCHSFWSPAIGRHESRKENRLSEVNKNLLLPLTELYVSYNQVPRGCSDQQPPTWCGRIPEL